MSEHYVFDTEAGALAAEAQITSIGGLPRTGFNAKTGEVASDDKAKTTCWAIPWMRITDNKWVFLRLPENIRNQYPQETHDAFNVAFPYTLEEYQTNWRPVEEDL
jgi:hypothetical protein